MTREERAKAISYLQISTPVRAMTQEEFDKYIYLINEVIKVLEQEPCEDAVSRRVVKELMVKYGFRAPDMTVTEFVEDELPSVQPMRKRDDVLDKARAEIMSKDGLEEALEIIDKYREESEVKE